MKKRVLIISHNPMNYEDNMGITINNIFSKFNSYELCQLYFNKQSVQSKNCNDFFLLNDISLIKSFFNFGDAGEIVKNNTIVKNKKNNVKLKKNLYTHIAREIIWKIGKWKSKKLMSWLKKTNPTCIFIAAGDYIFTFNIALSIAKIMNIPIYIYFTDEYYKKNKYEKNILCNIYKHFYRKKFKLIMSYCKNYFSISDDMLKLYKDIFKKDGNILMNTTNIKNTKKIIDEKIKIKYMGNLSCGRNEIIVEINDIINKINANINKKFELEVFSAETDEKILKEMKKCLDNKFKGKISKIEVEKKIEESDILIHMESMKKEYIKRVKYSISTKIPDILASGKLLLAYGPLEISSMKYIKNNNIGLVVSNKEELENTLIKISTNEIKIDYLIENALNIVEKNHRINVIHNKIYKIMMEE